MFSKIILLLQLLRNMFVPCLKCRMPFSWLVEDLEILYFVYFF